MKPILITLINISDFISKCTNYIYIYNTYVTGFAKRGLPHTSNSMNSDDHNLVDHNSVFKKHINMKRSPTTKLCWFSILTKFPINSHFQSEVTSCQSW